ncbi:nitroreductase [Actinoplanes sp. TBRC 11911]|uniref:Acg family FMN-binding oxidoreductase n=1 Tax=Actinoplanes sp. TBRC 11911 TaxID=2729386 RepID=UPI00145D1F87|nr:nitroreductase [Actinoplanes sp. TBRC 11911]NMO54648.1 nitroreductase [Actinoplanes sp. TBRC 11911]
MNPLEQAARAAQHAPSIFNTQPWCWRLTGDTLDLYADRDRHLRSVDRAGRLLLISCGTALHHARTALAAAGWTATVERLPEPEQPDLLARIRLGHEVAPSLEAGRLADAIRRRHTDRRAFDDREVADRELTRLRMLVEDEGAYLHHVREDQVARLAVAAVRAAGAERDDPRYRAELDRWTHRPGFIGDGVPPATAVSSEPRRVPVRDYAPDGEAGLGAGAAHDRGAAYVIVFGTSDRPLDLIQGGEALSALLLLATADGLATAPISDAVEVEWPRHLLRGLLAGIGEPYVAVRLGYLPAEEPDPPPAPRRDPRDVITIVE